MARRCPRRRLREAEADVQPVLGPRPDHRRAIGGRQRLDRARSQRQGRQRARLEHLPVLNERPFPAQVREIGKVVAIGHGEAASQRVHYGDAHGFHELLVLVERGVHRAVRVYQAVDAEAAVVGLLAEIPAVGVPDLALRGLLAQPLVDPVPHETAAQPPVALDGLPVLLQVAAAVPHGMRILAHDHRTIIRGILGVSDQPLDCRIHGRDDVAHTARHPGVAHNRLPVDGARRVQSTDGVRLGVDVAAHARLVAQ